MTRFVFLGTGGGRFVTITQKRKTAGIRVISGNLHVHVDPGPGALLASVQAGLSPRRVRGLLISHCHVDHYTDAEVFIEAMTMGATQKRGVLFAAKSVLEGGNGFRPVISDYHRGVLEKVVLATPGAETTVDNVRVIATKSVHGDPYTVGFRLVLPEGDVGYTSDTEYFEGIGEYYKGVRLLILCVLRPRGSKWPGHMSVDDAIKIIQESGPEVAVLTHFGMKMLRAGPSAEAKYVEKATGVRTIAAYDGMILEFGREITLEGVQKQKGLMGFM